MIVCTIALAVVAPLVQAQQPDSARAAERTAHVLPNDIAFDAAEIYNAPAAVRLYSAARVHNQRAGMRWPLRPVTAELLGEAAVALDRVAYEDAWQAGARLTLDDLEPACAPSP